MTPQSELQRLLGIPPELWEGELKGMSDEMLIDLIREPLPIIKTVGMLRDMAREELNKRC